MKKTQDDNEQVEEQVEESTEVEQELDEVSRIQEQLTLLQENERRAIADYKNLVRRTQEDRAKMILLASESVIEKLLQPFEHLYLAKQQLKDKGLDMVYQQFAQALSDEGLEVIECEGKHFDHTKMEVVDTQAVDDPKQVDVVLKQVSRGYTLHGQVIRHAKVVTGVITK